MDESAAKDKLYDEIFEFAQGRMGDELKKKYAPPPAPEAPAVENDGDADDQLDAESLQRLQAMAGG